MKMVAFSSSVNFVTALYLVSPFSCAVHFWVELRHVNSGALLSHMLSVIFRLPYLIFEHGTNLRPVLDGA
jgi:hypothetical protein